MYYGLGFYGILHKSIQNIIITVSLADKQRNSIYFPIEPW